ncbi:hypothetical protein GCM10010313_16470 [Streptomyces violarus]|uniref:GerMN domain-containing protein n=1 Tax=Streptomyces violarus TaxID=67380 RepID=A0A7W4ZMH2_9ACTN|nr:MULTISPECIES: hypothetical protein [Streptomyces]MBB3075175.1 hypothetical protein [Streptomyces violarus]WRT97805.1 hypothetical protein VJ737_08965 [Streptomyces sp. CGMCC 4.1772]GHD02557.1 hypothetical protein GCM10010313_16470 [Streptomyces violarus]
MTARRRAALLVVPVLCGLASCGIPATGVVEAGGPAGGVVPTIRVYFVADGMPAPVSRRVVAPIGAASAVEVLLQGPTAEEQAVGLKSLLPLTGADLPTAVPADPGRPPATAVPRAPATEVPRAAGATDFAKVTTRGHRVSIELSLSSAGDLPDLAVAQLICTAVEAHRVAGPGGEEVTAAVAGQDGRRIEGTAARCPAE